jgi:hypothetical protein
MAEPSILPEAMIKPVSADHRQNNNNQAEDFIFLARNSQKLANSEANPLKNIATKRTRFCDAVKMITGVPIIISNTSINIKLFNSLDVRVFSASLKVGGTSAVRNLVSI